MSDSTAAPGERPAPLLWAEGVTSGYGGVPVVRAVSIGVGPGEIVGEMSLIDHLARSATAVTLEECTTLWLDRTGFWHCLETIPYLNHNLARVLSRRLRMTIAHGQSLDALDLYARVALPLVGYAR